MTNEKEPETICPACGGWGEEAYFPEQAWDWVMLPCHLCKGSGEVEWPKKLPVLKMQNRSHAVMAQRIEPKDSPDDFPTPPWATRALIEYVLENRSDLAELACLEPACGAGHMARVLQEYFREVHSADAYDYGYGVIQDFLTHPHRMDSVDWVITNPPFRLAEAFVLKALTLSRHGVAILARTVFLESVGRYTSIFRDFPPTKFAQFVERVPMVRGRLDGKATTATGYAWLVWEKGAEITSPRLMWVPPCRKKLERDSDYTHGHSAVEIPI